MTSTYDQAAIAVNANSHVVAEVADGKSEVLWGQGKEGTVV